MLFLCSSEFWLSIRKDALWSFMGTTCSKKTGKTICGVQRSHSHSRSGHVFSVTRWPSALGMPGEVLVFGEGLRGDTLWEWLTVCKLEHGHRNSGFSICVHWTWWFSRVMSVYQRVNLRVRWGSWVPWAHVAALTLDEILLECCAVLGLFLGGNYLSAIEDGNAYSPSMAHVPDFCSMWQYFLDVLWNCSKGGVDSRSITDPKKGLLQ